jgi:peroxiredoxin
MTGDSTIEYEIAPDDIDGEFLPLARPDVASLMIGAELVLGRIPDGTPYVQACALNESGSIVWQCFDGTGSIDEIAADIADVFGADPAAVTADVLALAREVGAEGFLVGVHEAPPDFDEPGIAVGEPLPDFVARDEGGRIVSSAQFRGRAALIVSWSDTCRFCEVIVDDLAALVPRLAAVGVDVVLLATGHARKIRSMLDASRFTGQLLMQADDTESAFDGLGTPVAYLVDGTGFVAQPIALGAPNVVALARAALSPESL